MNMGIVWTVWLVLIAVSFAAWETYAIKTNRTTLSRWTWTVSKAWPPFPFVCGLIVGFLACHFWWGGIVCFAPVDAKQSAQLEMLRRDAVYTGQPLLTCFMPTGPNATMLACLD